MNKTELIAAVAEKTGLSKKDADKAVNAVIDSIVETVANEEKVQIVGFGTFEVRNRSERKGRDPRTNETHHHSRFQGSRVQGRQGFQGRHR